MKEIDASETLAKSPECVFEFVSMIWIFCPDCSVLSVVQDVGVDCAEEINGRPRIKAKNKSFRIGAPMFLWRMVATNISPFQLFLGL